MSVRLYPSIRTGDILSLGYTRISFIHSFGPFL